MRWQWSRAGADERFCHPRSNESRGMILARMTCDYWLYFLPCDDQLAGAQAGDPFPHDPWSNWM